MPSVVRTSITASADVVIGVHVRSLFEILLDPINISAPAKSDSIVRSLSPVELNSPAAQTSVKDLIEKALPASASDEPRALQAIPTADYVLRTGFKTDSKLVIKVVPMATGGASKDAAANKLDKITPELTFNQFSLQAIAEVDEERYQLHELFEGSVLYLFGRRPRIWTMQGMVTNGKRVTFIPPITIGRVTRPRTANEELAYRQKHDMDFANELLRRWDAYYRGSRAVELRARTFMAYDDVIIEATLLGLTCSRNAQVPSAVNVTLTFVVHERAFFGQQASEFTEASVKELIAKTLVFENKLTASQVLPPNVTTEQLRNLQAQAQEEVRQSQLTTAFAQSIVNGTDQSLASAIEVQEARAGLERAAQEEEADAQQDYEQAIANSDLAGAELARARKQQAINDQERHRAGRHQAEADEQKLRDQLQDNKELLRDAIVSQDDAVSKDNALAATIEQSGTTSGIPAVDEIVASVLSRTGGTEIGHSIIESTTTYILVEVTYRLPSGEIRSERVRRPL